MRIFRPVLALGSLGLAAALAATPAQAQSGLFLYAPTTDSASTFTTNAGATPTATGAISGGGSNAAFMSLIRGDQAFAYQTYNGLAASIQVINTATQAVVQTVATGIGVQPAGMALTPDGSTLYVANSATGNNTVTVYSVNATTGFLTQTGTISTGAGTRPVVLAVSADGKTLYIVNQSGNRVSVANTATNTVTATIPVGTAPNAVAINPAGTRLYVGNNTSRNVSVIDTATNTVVATVPTGGAGTPNSIAVSPSGQYFYIAVGSMGQIQIFDAGTNTQIGTVSRPGSGAIGLVISPDGTTLYVMNTITDSAEAFAINASTGQLTSLGTFSTGVLPNQPGMCGNGSSASGLLAGGRTFLATSNGALGCAGSSATMTGGTIVAGVDNLTMNTPIVLASQGGTVDTNGNSLTLGGAISGSGGLTKTGLGTLTLTGNSTYSGATAVNMGTLAAGITNAFSANSAYTVASGATLALNGFSQSIGSLAGAGAVTLGSATLTTGNDNTSTTFSGVMSGSGGLTKIGNGTLTLAGANTFTGGTVLNAGGLVVSGSLASGITVNAGTLAVTGSVAGAVVQNAGSTILSGGSLGGFTLNGGTASLNGAIGGTTTVSFGTLGGNASFGGLTVTGGTVAPGNSIGTITVNGNFAQGPGSIYQVEVNPQGQSDLITATGTATISGGTVAVQAQSGTYATSTTYTILTANGGRSGTYSGVTSNFAFLTPTLSYDANNVYLTLALLQNGNTSFGGFLNNTYTTNQRAVGYALNQSVAGASGDFATVIGALANLNTQQGSWALNQISGQPAADFGSFNVANNALFMNGLGQQMAAARGQAGGSGQRQALAQACEVEACDGVSPLSVWGSVLGGVGSVQGDGNASTLTYNVGGAAAGVDYRLSPSVLLGLGTGYTNGTQWVDSFMGKGWSNTVSVAAYGSYTPSGTLAGAYVDALAGYAYSNNQLQRQLSIPGLQPRMSSGSTGANQFLGQVETGYAFGVYAPANATVTPFARFQASSINQAAFQEWGASSLSLNVAQQTTTSLRSTLGAQLDGAIGGILLGLRLGWLHEYADTSRAITAAFSGAPSTSFTVYGATPQRDSAIIGLQASANVAAATQFYARYDGELGTGSDNHALTAGLRMTF